MKLKLSTLLTITFFQKQETRPPKSTHTLSAPACGRFIPVEKIYVINLAPSVTAMQHCNHSFSHATFTQFGFCQNCSTVRERSAPQQFGISLKWKRENQNECEKMHRGVHAVSSRSLVEWPVVLITWPPSDGSSSMGAREICIPFPNCGPRNFSFTECLPEIEAGVVIKGTCCSKTNSWIALQIHQ